MNQQVDGLLVYLAGTNLWVEVAFKVNLVVKSYLIGGNRN